MRSRPSLSDVCPATKKEPLTDVPGLRDVFAALREKMPNLPFNDTPPLDSYDVHNLRGRAAP